MTDLLRYRMIWPGGRIELAENTDDAPRVVGNMVASFHALSPEVRGAGVSWEVSPPLMEYLRRLANYAAPKSEAHVARFLDNPIVLFAEGQ